MRLAAAVHWYAEGRISRRRAEAIAGSERFASALAVREATRETVIRESGRATYAVDLLGLPTIHRLAIDGRKIELEWKLHKALETVAFLALAPDQRATKEAIVEAVWWEAGTDAVAKNFHPTLSYARRSLGDRTALVLRNGSYLLDPDLGWEVDALRFERLAAAGRDLVEPRLSAPGVPPEEEAGDPLSVDLAAATDRALELWRRAWKLYRGPLMAGRESPWIVPRREELRRAYLRTLADLGRAAVLRGKDTLALDAYRSVLIEDPYAERIHLEMMTLYSRQGRRDLLRRQYVRLQELLMRELNEEPSDETQERYHRLMGK
ncbi:MAG: bacterial transcriptional activator domain-containing protein [Thermoanaerobaculia bacterium]